MALTNLFTGDSGWNGSVRDPLAYAMLHIFKSGTAPLFGLSSKVKSFKAPAYYFKWSEKSPLEKRIPIIASAGVDGLATQVQLEDTTLFHPKTILLVEATGEQLLVHGITGNTVTVQRGFANTNPAPLLFNQAVPVYLYVMSNAHEEGSLSPSSYVEAPSETENYTQIFRKGFEYTGTARASSAVQTFDMGSMLRNGMAQQHGEDIEGAALFGEKSQSIHDGRPLRTTRGLFNFIRSNRVTVPSTGITARGMNSLVEALYRHAIQGYSNERIAFGSSVVLIALNELVAKRVIVFKDETDTAYGFKITTWVTPFGDLKIILHPKMQETTMFHGTLVAYHPAMFNKYVLRPTAVWGAEHHGLKDSDATGMITELGFGYGAEVTAMLVKGFYNADTQ